MSVQPSFGKPLYAGFTNAGVLTAVALVTASFARPALLALPYTLTVVATVWLWARGGTACMPRVAVRAGQLYTGQ